MAAVPTEETDAGASKRHAADISHWSLITETSRPCLPPSEVA